MKIVINISKEVYARILKAKSVPELLGIDIVNTINAVKDGTLLPKGHGDLIDRKGLKTHFIGTEQGTDLEVYLETTIIDAQAIIPADKESEE